MFLYLKKITSFCLLKILRENLELLVDPQRDVLGDSDIESEPHDEGVVNVLNAWSVAISTSFAGGCSSDFAVKSFPNIRFRLITDATFEELLGREKLVSWSSDFVIFGEDARLARSLAFLEK